MGSRSVSLIDYNPEQYVRALVYGTHGVGKTIFASSSCRLRTYVFDVDAGMMSAANAPHSYEDPRFQRGEMRVVWPQLLRIKKVDSKQDFLEGLTELETNIRYFDLVVVDTATELAKKVMDEILLADKVVVPTRPHWLQLLNIMGTTARSFHHLPVHTIWLCHEKYREHPEEKRMMYMPDFQGGFSSEYGRHFDEIWRLFQAESSLRTATGEIVRQVSRWLNCQKDPYTDTKDRSQALQKYEAPDIDAIFEKIRLMKQSGAQAIQP